MRNRILLLSIATASIAVLAVAVMRGPSTEARQPTPPTTSTARSQAVSTTRVWECFRVDANNDQHGADPKAVVRLITDNFGGKLVRVRKLVAMCELALKYQPVPGVPDPQPPADADTRIFAYGQVTTLGKPSGNIWQCFNLEKGKAINQKFRLLTNNFGRDDVAVIRGVQLCEDAMKLRQIDGTIVKSGEATGHVAECFRIESKLDPKARVTLTTNNFGAVDVVVRRAIMMCEPGEKTPIYELPSDIDFDAAGD